MKKRTWFGFCSFSFVWLLFGLLCLFGALFSLTSCRMDISFNGGNTVVYEGSSSWMSGMSDDTAVVNMVIPGTHDSCANYDYLGLSSTSATQDLTLKEQLESGVRCFDIRVYDDNGVYKIHHGLQYMHMTLDDVIETFESFLSANPGEFIIMMVMGEYKTDTDGVTEILESAMEENPSLWYQGTQLDSSVLLSDVRGKIIGALRYRDSSRTKCLDYNSYTERGVPYKTTDVSGNFSIGQAYVESVRNSSLSSLNITLFSCYYEGQFGIPNVRICSSSINRALSSYVSAFTGEGEHLGVIVTDHISRTLAHEIYMCNEF